MSSMTDSGDLYRVVKKDGTHLAESKETTGAVRGTLLSDSNRQIAGQAEFIKIDESEIGFSPTYEYSYVDAQNDVELTEEQQELAAMIGVAIAAGTVWVLSEVVAPHVKRWWLDTAAPRIKKAWNRLTERKNTKENSGKQQLRDSQVIDAGNSVQEMFTQELDEAYEKYVNDLTSEEAQRELIDIFILSTIVTAKIRKLSNSRIINEGSLYADTEGQAVAEKLSAPHYVESINRILMGNTTLLEETSHELSVIFGYTLVVNGQYVPFNSKVIYEALARNT